MSAREAAAPPPYFHNGTAATLDEMVRHYRTHLGFVFTDEERADLVAFLNAPEGRCKPPELREVVETLGRRGERHLGNVY
jgi:cytochrome c peroxidase